MTAVTVPLTIEQGATKHFTLTWGSGTSEADLVPYDLAGCTAEMMVKKTFTTEPAMLEASTDPDDGIVLQPGGQLGVIDVTLDAVKTDALDGTTGRWDLEVTWPDGRVDRVAEGQVTISLSVTRP